MEIAFVKIFFLPSNKKNKTVADISQRGDG